MKLLEFLDERMLTGTMRDWSLATGLSAIVYDEDGEQLGDCVGSYTADQFTLNDVSFDLEIGSQYFGKIVMKGPDINPDQEAAGFDFLKFIMIPVIGNALSALEDENLLHSIAQQITVATSIINEINEKSKELDKLGNKQKILALNASIEAARAGDAGRGFAIVASNVADLATNSTRINGTIKDSLSQLTEVIEKLNKQKEA